MSPRRIAAFLAVLLGFSALSGCAPAVPQLDGLSVEILQLRSDVASRTAQLRVTNDTRSDLVIERLVFSDGWFVEDAIREQESIIPVGWVIDLRIPLPESQCEDAPDAQHRSREVRLTLKDVGEVARSVTESIDFSEALHTRECLMFEVEAVATLEVAAFRESLAPEPGVLEIALTPQGGTEILELGELHATNLLAVSSTGETLPLGRIVSGTEGPSVIEVPILPQRCDPHAVMEDKRGTIFPLQLRVGQSEGLVELVTEDSLKNRILSWVLDWCGV